MKNSIFPVVDIFAGPGGLGEGFSALHDGNAFSISVSAEMDKTAHQTLQLRAFYRLLKNRMPERLNDYYAFCNGISTTPYTENSIHLWKAAEEEALCVELGTREGNAALDQAIESRLGPDPKAKPWVLIGGPPCQAYSLVGRARNKGIVDYKAENDKRTYLYKEYLRILTRYQPAIFVMENVKGILSAKVTGKNIFNEILNDLSSPARAFDDYKSESEPKYVIHSLTVPQSFSPGSDPLLINQSNFIIRAEDHGIPQSRHRVILLGIRSDLLGGNLGILEKKDILDVEDIIDNLPKLRSKLSKEPDSSILWQGRVSEVILALSVVARESGMPEISRNLTRAVKVVCEHHDIGGLRVQKKSLSRVSCPTLDNWLRDDNLKVWLNHESRGHRIDDLARYAYAAAFAEAYGKSPKGHIDFSLPGLEPNHKNWKSGKFQDRFRVQTKYGPATTITSHISKDGHYFIHYDPSQCRSLTVREAARLQTFPDNYFFQGNKTMQYHQVGNAVPPYLANKIAQIVYSYLISLT